MLPGGQSGRKQPSPVWEETPPTFGPADRVRKGTHRKKVGLLDSAAYEALTTPMAIQAANIEDPP